MPDKIKEVFELISDKGYFSDENEFRSYVSDPKRRAEAFELIKDDGFFTDENEFNSYFGDVKKKEQAIPFDGQQFGGKSEEPLLPLTSSTVSPSVSKQPKSTIPLESTGAKSKQAPFQNVDISRPDLEIEPEGTKDEKDLYAKESPSERIGKMLNIQSMPSEKPAFMEDLRQRAEVDDKILNDPTFTLLSSEAGDKNEAKRVKLFEEKNRAIASERGYKDVKELYSDMDEYLADFLGEREKEEYIGKRDRVELLKQINQAKAIGQPTEELQKKYDEQVAQFSKAKADLIINADQDIRNLRRELEGADPEEKAEILSQIDGLEASKKDFFKPKTQGAKEIAEGEGLTEGSTDQEKVQIYAHSLMRERSDLREALGITKDRDAMIAYYVTAGGDNPYWRRLQDVEDKLESVAPVVLINETPITGTESAWSVFGKVFKENLMPEATDKGTQQEVAGNLIKGLDLAGVDVKNIQEDTYKTLDKTSKPYEDWSSKDLALMAAPTLAIMPKFIAATIATEGLGSFAAISPYWRSIKILSQRGSLGAAATEGSLLKVIQANKYGRGLLQAGFKGLEYGTQSQVETMIFAADKGEMGFVNGLVGGSLGVGAEKLTQLAGKGIAKVLTSIFGNKAPDATSKILAAAKKVYTYTKEENTKALGEVGEELGEDLGGMWMDSENGKEFFEKINESYGTPSKALKFFLSTYMMGYGIGAAGQLGSAAFSSAGKMYKNLSAKDRAIADNVISDLRQEQNNADVDAGIDLVKDSNLSEKEKAKAEKQITAQGAAVNGVIEGNLTTEELNDVVSSLEEQTPSVKFESPEINLAVPENPYDKSLRKLGYTDSDIEKMTIEQKQEIAENKIESPIVESSAKVDSIKENKKQERLAEMNAELDAEAKESEKTENEKKVEELRAQEQAELAEAIPNIEEYKVDGKVDESLITDAADLKAYRDIYERYNDEITPLLEGIKEKQAAPLPVEEVAKEQAPEYIEQTEKNRKIIKTENIKNNFPVLYERVIKNFSNAAWDSADIRDALSYLISKKPTYKKGMEQLISAQIEAEKLLSELGEDADFITKKQLLEKINSNESYSKDQKDVFSNIVNRLKGDRFFDFTNKNIDSDNGYQFSNNLLKAKDADAFIHEVGHWGFYNLLSSEERTKYLEYVKDRFYGTKNKISDDLAIKRENKILDKILESNSEDNFSEYFAEQFRQYVVDGLAPKELESIFEKFKEYLTEIVKLFKDKGYNKDLKPFFDKIIREQALDAEKTGEAPAKEQKEEVKEQEVSEAEEADLDSNTKVFEKVAVEKPELVASAASNVFEDAGYHMGTLSGKSDYIDESYTGDMPFTGYYFLSNPKEVVRGGSRRSNPKAFRIVDFSKYKLLRFENANFYYGSKSALKKLAKDLLDGVGVEKALNKLLENKNVSPTLKRQIKESYGNKQLLDSIKKDIAKYNNLLDSVKSNRDYDAINKEIDLLREQLRNISKEGFDIQLSSILEDYKKRRSTEKYSERLETLILKGLGYEGIDVRGIKEEGGVGSPDKLAEGSVIFDLKPQTATNLSEAYRKAKAEGVNPKLVQAVEELLGKEQTPEVKKKKTPPQNVLDIAKETGLSPQEVENTYKKYDDTKSIEEITIEDYNSARAAGNEQKLENSKKAFEALLKADSDSPTAKKKVAKIKEEVSKETLKEASDIMNNIDNIRQQLLDAGVIKSINCKWG
jgi:hypothetical protein